MAKKYNWNFWTGIAYSTVIYTIFLTVISILSRYKLKVDGVDDYDEMIKLSIKLAPSIFNAVITGAVLSAVIFAFVGYICYSGKQIIYKLEATSKYVKYVMYALAATVVGLVLHLINAIIAVKSSLSDLGSNFLMEMVLDGIPESVNVIAAFYATVLNWYFSFFGKLSVKINEDDGDASSFGIAWFFNDGFEQGLVNGVLDSTTFIPRFIMVILVFALVGAMGFLLTKAQLLDWKEAAIIAGIFTAIQLAMLYFINVNIEISGGVESGQIVASIVWIRQLFTTIIFAFAAIMAGSFVKIKFFFGK